MTRAELDAVAARNDKRKLDPNVHYQYGCAGRTRGVHHHDDRCDPPATVDIDVLLAEVEWLRHLDRQCECVYDARDLRVHTCDYIAKETS